VTGGAVFAVNNFGDTRSGGLAGPMALLFVVLLAIATVLLIRNMNARLRRLPDQFPAQGGSRPDGPGAESTGQSDSGREGAGEGHSGQEGTGQDRSGTPRA
jgi:hypothetical protein